MSNKNYERFPKKYSVDEIFDLCQNVKFDGKTKIIIDEHPIKISSARIHAFYTHGIFCAHCGIKGSFFVKERIKSNPNDPYHLNLYAIDNDGEEVLMTKDHIIPVSKGGRNHISNYQPMCFPCNNIKSNK